MTDEELFDGLRQVMLAIIRQVKRRPPTPNTEELAELSKRSRAAAERRKAGAPPGDWTEADRLHLAMLTKRARANVEKEKARLLAMGPEERARILEQIGARELNARLSGAHLRRLTPPKVVTSVKDQQLKDGEWIETDVPIEDGVSTLKRYEEVGRGGRSATLDRAVFAKQLADYFTAHPKHSLRRAVNLLWRTKYMELSFDYLYKVAQQIKKK